MKKLITITLLLLVVIACKKVNESTNNEFLTANIDGVNYSFSDKVNVNSTSELTHIINGYNKKLKTRITLGLNLDKQETGTFELNGNMVLVYHSHIIFKEKRINYLWHAKTSIIGSSATITITKNSDTYIEGTFLFKGVGATKVDTSVKNVTEGKFRVLKK